VTSRGVAAFAAVAISACASESGSGLARPEVDTLPNGVVTVHNTGPAGWADTSGWRLVETARIVASDSGDQSIVNPSGVAVDGAGRLYVGDRAPVGIKVFDRSGAFVRSIGRDGEGPGEYRSPIVAIHGPHLIVQDPRLARLTVYDTSGALLRTWPSACCHYRSIAVDGEGRILVAAPSEPRPGYSAAFLRFTVDGELVDTVWVPKGGELRSWDVARGRTMMMRMTVPFAAGDLESFTPDGMLAHAWSADYRYAIIRPPNDTVRIVSKAWTPIERPESQRRKIFDQIVEGQTEQLGAELVARHFHFEDIPATAMPMGHLDVDPEGYAWVGVFAGDTLHGSYDVFDPVGIYLGRVAVPWLAGEAFVQWHGADELVTIGETEEGYPEIVRYRIDRSAVRER
jgi:hypothetical protein